jgi:multimeric flavodoxin WrbA
MKVLLINGSPRESGCIGTAFQVLVEEFAKEGIDTEVIHVGNKDIRGCVACGGCSKKGQCVFNDLVNEVAPKFEAADGLVVGSPVYYGQPNGTVVNFVQRLFYSTPFPKTMKVGASVVSCRRGGNSASFEQLNQFFGISGMPMAPSTYWNDVHGFGANDVLADEEGVQTMRNLARNMSFLIRAIAAEKEKNGLPELAHGARTHFIM